MSYANLLARAASQAQGVLADLQGAPGSTGKNFLYNGGSYLGIFGSTQLIDVPRPSGGYRRQAIQQMTATRTQFTTPPVPKLTLTRTDLTPPQSYLVTAIDLHDPLHYVFAIVKNGP